MPAPPSYARRVCQPVAAPEVCAGAFEAHERLALAPHHYDKRHALGWSMQALNLRRVPGALEPHEVGAGKAVCREEREEQLIAQDGQHRAARATAGACRRGSEVRDAHHARTHAPR